MPESVEYGMTPVPAGVWSESDWKRLERQTCARALRASSEEAAREIIIRQARAVLRAYSTSFFIVTRFLPPRKRAQVEAVYAAVRYPDEIVDSFPLAPAERMRRIDAWAAQYEEALAADSIKDSLRRRTPCFLASFSRVVREAAIPPEHYRSFIAAMRLDVCPRHFRTLDDLIESSEMARTDVEPHGGDEGAVMFRRNRGFAHDAAKACKETRRSAAQRVLDRIGGQGFFVLRGPGVETAHPFGESDRKAVHDLVRVANRGVNGFDLGAFAGREKTGDDEETRAVDAQHCARLSDDDLPGRLFGACPERACAGLPLKPVPITLTPNAGGDRRHSILNRLRHKALWVS